MRFLGNYHIPTAGMVEPFSGQIVGRRPYNAPVSNPYQAPSQIAPVRYGATNKLGNFPVPRGTINGGLIR